MNGEPVVDLRPSCGAPLHVDDQGRPHWCHEHVRIDVEPSESTSLLQDLRATVPHRDV